MLKRAARPEILATEAQREHEVVGREGHSFDDRVKTLVAILLQPSRRSSAKQERAVKLAMMSAASLVVSSGTHHFNVPLESPVFFVQRRDP